MNARLESMESGHRIGQACSSREPTFPKLPLKILPRLVLGSRVPIQISASDSGAARPLPPPPLLERMLLVDAPLLLLEANDCHKRWASVMPALRCIVLCLDVAARGEPTRSRGGMGAVYCRRRREARDSQSWLDDSQYLPALQMAAVFNDVAAHIGQPSRSRRR